MGRRVFPSFFEEAALALDFRPRAGGNDLPPLTAEQSDFPRGEREPPDYADKQPAPNPDGVPWWEEGHSPSTPFAVSSIPAAGGRGEPEHDDVLSDYLGQAGQGRRVLTTDTIASYAAWHRHGASWGISVHARALESYARYIGGLAGADVARVRPIVARQVIVHELAHFAIEVMATELELRARKAFFRDYLDIRYGRTPGLGLPGPIEEAIASYREVAFARAHLPSTLRPKPGGYLRAVKDAHDLCGAGYRDWRLMERSSRPATLAAHLDLLTGPLPTPAVPAALTRHAHGIPLPGEVKQVPFTWLGDPGVLVHYGLQRKSVAPPTIRKFERWLTRTLKCPPPSRAKGKGSHYKATLPDGSTISYGTSHGYLLPNESSQLVKRLGLSSRADLYERIAQRKPLPRTAGREASMPGRSLS